MLRNVSNPTCSKVFYHITHARTRAMSRCKMSRESKGELRKRLRRERRFGAFIARREELKRQGESAYDAWRIAAEEFPPVEDASFGAPCTAAPAGDCDTQPGWPHDDDPRWIDDTATEPEPPDLERLIVPPRRATPA